MGPISLITQGAAQSAVNGWNTIPVPAAYLNAGTYWLVCQVQNSTQVVTGFGDKTECDRIYMRYGGYDVRLVQT